MSLNKLKKYIDKTTFDADLSLQYTPIVLSDSKGKYLKTVRNVSTVEQKIVWLCKSGLKSTKLVHWLDANFNNLVREHGPHIVLFIWVGTCDLTVKSGKFISLAPEAETALTTFKENLQRIKASCDSKNIKVVFLQVPYYSIQVWNKAKCHPDPDSFKADDFRLSDLIDSANIFISQVNQVPKFCQDMVRSRKATHSRARYSINFNLLRDGIHPSTTLSKAWYLSLVKRICADCV